MVFEGCTQFDPKEGLSAKGSRCRPWDLKNSADFGPPHRERAQGCLGAAMRDSMFYKQQGAVHFVSPRGTHYLPVRPVHETECGFARSLRIG